MNNKNKIRQISSLGYELIIIGNIATSETARLARENEFELKLAFGDKLIDSAKNLDENDILEESLKLLNEFNDTLVFPLDKKGINEALWKFADQMHTGVMAYIDDMPILRESIEISDYYLINPYEMDSRGALLVASLDGRRIMQRFEKRGIKASIIGHSMKEKKVMIYGEGIKRTLIPPK